MRQRRERGACNAHRRGRETETKERGAECSRPEERNTPKFRPVMPLFAADKRKIPGSAPPSSGLIAAPLDAGDIRGEVALPERFEPGGLRVILRPPRAPALCVRVGVLKSYGV